MTVRKNFNAPASILGKLSSLVCREMVAQNKNSAYIIEAIERKRTDIPNLVGTLAAVREGHNTSWPTGYIMESRVENFLLGISYILDALDVPANHAQVNKLRMSPYAIDYFLYPPR